MIGRTTEKWGRDRSARWDLGSSTRSYPARPRTTQPLPDRPPVWRETLPGRRGAAETQLTIAQTETGDLEIRTHGWYAAVVTLNPRQVAFLRETLDSHAPES